MNKTRLVLLVLALIGFLPICAVRADQIQISPIQPQIEAQGQTAEKPPPTLPFPSTWYILAVLAGGVSLIAGLYIVYGIKEKKKAEEARLMEASAYRVAKTAYTRTPIEQNIKPTITQRQSDPSPNYTRTIMDQMQININNAVKEAFRLYYVDWQKARVQVEQLTQDCREKDGKINEISETLKAKTTAYENTLEEYETLSKTHEETVALFKDAQKRLETLESWLPMNCVEGMIGELSQVSELSQERIKSSIHTWRQLMARLAVLSSIAEGTPDDTVRIAVRDAFGQFDSALERGLSDHRELLGTLRAKVFQPWLNRDILNKFSLVCEWPKAGAEFDKTVHSTATAGGNKVCIVSSAILRNTQGDVLSKASVKTS